jgi:BolA protein
VTTSVADTLQARLAELQPSMLDIQDDSAQHAGHAGSEAGGRHYSVTIVSEHFHGLYLIPHPVHALAIRAYAPDEFPSPRKD